MAGRNLRPTDKLFFLPRGNLDSVRLPTAMSTRSLEDALAKKPHPFLDKAKLFSQVLPKGVTQSHIRDLLRVTGNHQPKIALKRFSGATKESLSFFARLDFKRVWDGSSSMQSHGVI
jgi:hypothetical protein